jgi:hypothetical protein
MTSLLMRREIFAVNELFIFKVVLCLLYLCSESYVRNSWRR